MSEDKPCLEWKLRVQGVLAEELDRLNVSTEQMKMLCDSSAFRKFIHWAIVCVIGR